MSLLKNKQRGKKDTLNCPVSTRLSKSEYEKFEQLCENTGYKMSEALRMLIVNELNTSGKQNVYDTKRLQYVNDTFVDKSIQNDTNGKQSVNESIQNENKSIQDDDGKVIVGDQVFEKKKTTSGRKGRFSLNRWKVDNRVPCPICEEWVSAANFSRHAKDIHKSNTKAIFDNLEEKADELVRTLKD
jgi:hypothetical protein